MKRHNYKDLNIKAAHFVKVLGIINQIFKPSLVSRHTRIRIYKTLARPVLSYRSEAWTIRTDEKRLISRNAFPEEDCRIQPLGPQKKLRYFNRITNVTDNRIHISV
jgi:hypothetical protein